MTKRSRRSGLDETIAETAQGMHRIGLMDDATLSKITLREIKPDRLARPKSISGKEIVKIREGARMSQAVFARVLDVSTGTLSKWERDEQHPRGPAARLLAVIRAKGVMSVVRSVSE